MAEEINPGSSKGRKIRAYILLGLVIAAVIVVGWYYYQQYTKYYSTDDAYIDSDRVSVSSKILGRIIGTHADEGDTVRLGQLLVDLDSSDLVSQRVQATAACDQAVASVKQANAKYELDQKSTRVQEINVEKAKEDLERATIQFDGEVITKEQFDHTNKSYQAAVAQLDASRAQLAVGKSQIESASLTIKTAAAQIGTIETGSETPGYSPLQGGASPNVGCYLATLFSRVSRCLRSRKIH